MNSVAILAAQALAVESLILVLFRLRPTFGLAPLYVCLGAFQVLQICLGGLQVNDMNLFGRTYKVMVQAEPEFRASPANVGDIFVRGASGAMLPLSTVVRLGDKTGTDVIQRFNLFRCAEISGAPAAGYSSGQALEAMERVAEKGIG